MTWPPICHTVSNLDELNLAEDEIHCPICNRVRGEFYQESFEISDKNVQNFSSADNFQAAGKLIGRCKCS